MEDINNCKLKEKEQGKVGGRVPPSVQEIGYNTVCVVIVWNERLNLAEFWRAGALPIIV